MRLLDLFASAAGKVPPFVGYFKAAGLAALVAFGGWKSLQVDRLELKLEAVQADKRELQARIDLQNESIRMVKRAADAAVAEQERKATQAAAAAKAARSRTEVRIERIMSAPVPDQSCESAIQLLIDDAGAPQ